MTIYSAIFTRSNKEKLHLYTFKKFQKHTSKKQNGFLWIPFLYREFTCLFRNIRLHMYINIQILLWYSLVSLKTKSLERLCWIPVNFISLATVLEGAVLQTYTFRKRFFSDELFQSFGSEIFSRFIQKDAIYQTCGLRIGEIWIPPIVVSIFQSLFIVYFWVKLYLKLPCFNFELSQLNSNN